MDEYRLRNLIEYWTKGGASGNVNANSAIVQSLQRQLDDVLAQRDYIPSERYISNANLSDISRYSRPYQMGMDGWQDWRNYTPPAQPMTTTTTKNIDNNIPNNNIPNDKTPTERRPEDYDSYADGVIKDEPINVYIPSVGEPTYNYAYSQPPASGEIDYEDPNYSEILDAAKGKKTVKEPKTALNMHIKNILPVSGKSYAYDDIDEAVKMFDGINLYNIEATYRENPQLIEAIANLPQDKYNNLTWAQKALVLRAQEVLNPDKWKMSTAPKKPAKAYVKEKGKVNGGATLDEISQKGFSGFGNIADKVR